MAPRDIHRQTDLFCNYFQLSHSHYFRQTQHLRYCRLVLQTTSHTHTLPHTLPPHSHTTPHTTPTHSHTTPTHYPHTLTHYPHTHTLPPHTTHTHSHTTPTLTHYPHSPHTHTLPPSTHSHTTPTLTHYPHTLTHYPHTLTHPPIYIYQGRIFIISLGGVDKSWGGGCNFSPDNGLARRRFALPHSREFFPDIGLLARRNFANTIRDLL